MPAPISLAYDAYVVDGGFVKGTVSVLDTQTNQVVGAPIAVGSEPEAIAISPDGKDRLRGQQRLR